MQESVPSASDVQATFVATLVDEWCRNGLADVVLCPGSRSTPLALAFSEREELALHIRIDERSAAFFAIGRALATGQPVAVVVTSGTAAAELHAAVAEADLSRVPLVVVTADRPPELHGVGAPQTIDQRAIFGTMVRRFEEPGVARLEASGSWRALANRLWLSAKGSGPGTCSGPVHLNAAFVEPLLGTTLELPPGRLDGRPWTIHVDTDVEGTALGVQGRRVLAVVGQGVAPATIALCRELDWVVVGDATAQGTLAYVDPLLRDDAFARDMAPDVVVRIGGLPASKVLQERLRQWNVRVIGLLGAGPVSDPDGLVGELVEGLPLFAENQRGDASYARRWDDASSSVGDYLDSREGDELDEPGVARTVVTMSTTFEVALVVGSSMPVRDVEWWSESRTIPTFANRGANGIDGVVSTVFGVGASGRVLGLVGDVTFLHDVSALVDGLGEVGGTCVLVVSDNGGGGIFSFLPQANHVDGERFERIFGTPRRHDLVAVARAFGHSAERVRTRRALRDAIAAGLSVSGITVLVADVPARDRNVALHEALNADVQRRPSPRT